MTITEITDGKSEICDRILRALPDWFGIEQAIQEYVHNTVAMPMFAVSDGTEIVGFASLKLHNKWTAEIYVMGVLAEHHRHGLGRKLVDHCEAYLTAKGYRFLTVKTLGPSRECAEYERTRKFYESIGFLPIEEFTTLWGEGNPCLFMVKPLNGVINQ